MKPKIVAPSVLAKKIADSATWLGEEVGRGNGMAVRVALANLLTHLDREEAAFLIQLLTEPRVQCAECGKWRALRRCSGAYCLQCSSEIRAAQEMDLQTNR